MTEVLQNALSSPSFCHDKVQKGYERVKRFTVDKTEKETAAVYRSLVR